MNVLTVSISAVAAIFLCSCTVIQRTWVEFDSSKGRMWTAPQRTRIQSGLERIVLAHQMCRLTGLESFQDHMRKQYPHKAHLYPKAIVFHGMIEPLGQIERNQLTQPDQKQALKLERMGKVACISFVEEKSRLRIWQPVDTFYLHPYMWKLVHEIEALLKSCVGSEGYKMEVKVHQSITVDPT